MRQRLDRPTPRVAIGLQLPAIAHACIDLSDGLLADLGHVCTASGVGAVVEVDALPASAALCARFDADHRQALQASGGDDYELCFSAPVSARGTIAAIAADTATPIHRIGRAVVGNGVCVLDRTGMPWQSARAGYVHFDGAVR